MASITDLIQELLDNGVQMLAIGHVPNQKELYFVKADQWVATGTEGCNCQTVHQKTDRSIANALKAVKRDVDHCREMGAMEVPRRDGN